MRISVRTDPANPATEIGSTDLLEHQYLRNSAGALTGPTLQAAVFAGQVQLNQLVTVREVLTPSAAQVSGDVDTAVFAAPRSAYTITPNADGSVTVSQTGALATGQKVSDGIDTLWNVERAQFSDQTVGIAFAAAPTAVTAAQSGPGAVRVSFTPPPAGALPLTGFVVQRFANGVPAGTTGVAPTATSAVVSGLAAGTTWTFRVQAVNANGPGTPSALSKPGGAHLGTPGADGGDRHARQPQRERHLDPAGQRRLAGDLVGGPGAGRDDGAAHRHRHRGATSAVVGGLTQGTTYTFRVQAVNAVGTGPLSGPATRSQRPPCPMHR